MNDDRTGSNSAEKSWLDKIGHLFSSEPRTRKDLEDVLSVAAENEVIDDDARGIIAGALQVSDMQTREIMIPRSQMVVIKNDCTLEEILKLLLLGLVSISFAQLRVSLKGFPIKFQPACKFITYSPSAFIVTGSAFPGSWMVPCSRAKNQ